MIKGARKQMIVVRTSNSRYFDEAYFVLKEEAQKETRKSSDILGEANRLLAELTPQLPPPRQKQTRQWIFFGVGGCVEMCYMKRNALFFTQLTNKIFISV